MASFYCYTVAWMIDMVARARLEAKIIGHYLLLLQKISQMSVWELQRERERKREGVPKGLHVCV